MNWRKFLRSPYAGVICATLLIYVPLMSPRVLRMAGDEKVYIAQAHEMKEAGAWFAQSLFGKPDYFKGPAHYVLLRIGFGLFGDSNWAVIYMNLLFLLLGACALVALAGRIWPKRVDLALAVGLLFVSNVGIFTHLLTSQMEIGLAGLFAVGLFLLHRSRPGGDLAFWLVAGVMGWMKSPLHSVFLGLSGILYWAMLGSLTARLKSPRSWGQVGAGIAVCALGYLPGYLADPKNFIELYVMKETMNKSSSGLPWWISLESTFGFYLFPWVFLGLLAYVGFAVHRMWKKKEDRVWILLSLAIVLPSAVFFVYHPYRYENYNLPVISGVCLFIVGSLHRLSKVSRRWVQAGFALTALLMGVLASLLVTVHLHFKPHPQWWPEWLGVWTEICLLGGLMGLGVLIWRRPAELLRYGFWAGVPLYWVVGVWVAMLGEREMVDLRNYVRERPEARLSYDNLERRIWSEWALLQHAIHREVRSVHSDELLREAVQEGRTLLVAGDGPLGELQKKLKSLGLSPPANVLPWKRWQTRPETIRRAWSERDLSALERNFYIVEFVNKEGV